MRIGIDIDDTLTNTSDVMFKYAKKYNKDYDNVILDDIPNLVRGIKTKKQTDEFFRKYCFEMILSVDVKENAKNIIDKLLKEGHEIFFITARSNEYFGDSYVVTKEYLRKNGIKYTKLLTGHVYKLKICKEEKIDIFFDDAYDTINELHNDGVDAVLFTSNLNRERKIALRRVDNWNELYYYVYNKCNVNV